MRTTLKLDGRAFYNDSDNAYTHAVVVRLNREALIPPGYQMTQKDFNEIKDRDERAKLMDAAVQFRREETSGRFDRRVAQWAESLAEANRLAAAYESEKTGDQPKYVEVLALPISSQIGYAS